jgi:tRNA 2-selenouridine synthase
MIPVVLNGQTGSGKTRLLKELSSRGFSVIDLESLANHRGSAFGLLNIQGTQPAQDEFEQNIRTLLDQSSYSKFIFLEFESGNLGKLNVPAIISNLYKTGIQVILKTNIDRRVANILEEYLPADKAVLLESLDQLKDRIGKNGQDVFDAQNKSLENAEFNQLKSLLESEQYKEFCYRILEYYDQSKNYTQHLVYDLIIENQGSEKNADELLGALQARFNSFAETRDEMNF